MSVELFRRARRAEARAERAEDRRRFRLEFFRQALTQGFDSLKVRHAEGASGQESVHAHARLMDDVIFSLTRLIAADAAARRAGVLIVLPLGLCFLPAFVLAGLVPVIVAVLGDVLSP